MRASKLRFRGPAGVNAIAALHLLAAGYLWTIALVMLFAPGVVSVMSGARFLFGLELAGPYMRVLVGCAWATIGWGLLRLHNWARWATMGLLTLQIAALVPRLGAAAIGLPLLWYGFQIAIVAAVGWYLAQSSAVLEAFVDNRSD